MESIIKSIKNKLLVAFIFCTALSFAQEKLIIPLAIIEDLPRFPNCINDSLNSKEAKECFNKEMTNHILLNFNYPKVAQKNKIQGRVLVTFIINSEGE
jgi:protein TonB